MSTGKIERTAAIKKFAERLKDGVPQETGVIRCADIDNLVKELTEAEDNYNRKAKVEIIKEFTEELKNLNQYDTVAKREIEKLINKLKGREKYV